MNKSKFVALFVALAGLTAAAPAAAQVSFYFGGSIGDTQAKEDICAAAQFNCDRGDTGWSGNVGLMFNPNWGVEFAVRDMGTVLESDDGAGNSAKWTTKTGEGVIVGRLPLSEIGLGDKLAVYGKAGAYYAKTQLRSTGTYFLTNGESSNRQWTYGVGISYDVFKHLRLRAEWQRYNNLGGADVGFRADVEVLSGGVVIVF
jgi:OOP family OmpA-OmpF porin